MNTAVFIYLEFLRKTLLPLPGVTERMCFGTPAFYAGKKLFARLKEDGETLAITSAEREKWMQLYPEVYFVTDHYLNYDYVLARLDKVDPEQLKEVLLIAWRARSAQKVINEYDKNNL